MKMLVLSIIVFLVSLILAATSFYFGQRLTTQKYEKVNTFLKDESIEAFCADAGCQTIGLKGTIASYDYTNKKIDFLTKETTHFNVFLADSVKIDDSYGIAYFEEKMRKGDVVYVVFDLPKSKGSNLVATDVYIYKTGVLAKKRILLKR